MDVPYPSLAGSGNGDAPLSTHPILTAGNAGVGEIHLVVRTSRLRFARHLEITSSDINLSAILCRKVAGEQALGRHATVSCYGGMRHAAGYDYLFILPIPDMRRLSHKLHQ